MKFMKKKLNLYSNKKSFFVLSLIALCLFSSCQTIRNSGTSAEPLNAKLTWAKKFPLLPTEKNPAQVEFFNQVELTHEGKTEKFSILGVANNSIIQFSVLDTNKNQLNSVLRYDTKTVELKKLKLDVDIQPEDLVALFQWCYYDITDIALALNESGLLFTVETTLDQNTEIRRIYNGKKCLIEIEKTTNKIEIQNYYQKYLFRMYLES